MTETEAKPSNLTKATIAIIAGNVRNAVHYENPNDIESAVECMGGRIERLDVYSQDLLTLGSIEVDAPQKFLIRTALQVGPKNTLFTVAHEIGHYILHYLYRRQFLGAQINKMIAYRKMKGRAESEANVFAACFLMPQNDFTEQFHKFNGSRAALSSHFGVPSRLVASRILGLGLAAVEH